MAARQNIIVVIPKDWARIRSVLAQLQSLVGEWIGSPTTLSVQDFSTGSIEDCRIIDAVTGPDFPEASETEIVALYPDDQKRGAVLALHEGPYDLIILSVGERGPAVDRLNRIWSLVGEDAHAVLIGEELEVDGNQIEELLHSEMLPPQLDLCEAAIVRSPSSRPRIEGQDSPYDGRLLLRKMGSS